MDQAASQLGDTLLRAVSGIMCCMISRRIFTTSAAAALAATPARAQSRAVLVELFTSQGCSSCPPADAVLTRLSQRAGVVALAFHVDYWDYIGWKDPYASPGGTKRQRDYRVTFGNNSVYTPQMVLNGSVEFPGQNEAEALRAVASAAATSGPDITMVRTSSEVRIELAPASVRGEMAVFGAVYASAKSTRVSRGENAGRTLTNSNIVRSFGVLGDYNGDATAISWTPKLEGAPVGGLAVWIQPKTLGPVIAAASLTLGGAA